MPERSQDDSLLWRVEQRVVTTPQAPATSLVSVAHANGAYFVVVRGDISAVVDRPFDPEVDVPTERLRVDLEVAGVRLEQTSAMYGADRRSWEALLQWAIAEPAPRLRVTLELDGKSCVYVLVRAE